MDGRLRTARSINLSTSDFLHSIGTEEGGRSLEEAFHWYCERSPIAADAFRIEVIEAIDSLAEDPLMWPADTEAVRYYILRRFPYTIHYEVAGSEVIVLAVAHQRRRPGYWQDR